ncbi:hypothetical protein GCM10023191_101760 [Actinoallomurus oryzae]|uniref:AAA domain-containing protein n=1 Tax=Actinoallomurus oryzae TaxID=502180 RepID=A0ABP8R9L0_9ACTN
MSTDVLSELRADPALIVLIGVAGAGKSTLAAGWGPTQVLSLDALRGAVSDDDCDQDATADAVTVLHTVLAARMHRRLTTVVDATNLTTDARRPLLELARANHVPAIAIVLTTPLPDCHTRNATRPGLHGAARWGRRVPVDVVDAQHCQLLQSIPHLHTEGFAEIHLAGKDA